jgi:hypothetical protein
VGECDSTTLELKECDSTTLELKECESTTLFFLPSYSSFNPISSLPSFFNKGDKGSEEEEGGKRTNPEQS